ncbi:MAG: monovalent cation/H(+) antiporter subunit G [Pseudomonadota bacterium]
MALAIDILSWISFVTGAFFLFVGSLGMVRLRDFWARLHAASIIDSAGAGLILLGMALQTGFTLITVKTLLIVGFLMLTGPTASHAVANAAFASGSRPCDLVHDETSVEDAPTAKPKSKRAKSPPAKIRTRKATR